MNQPPTVPDLEPRCPVCGSTNVARGTQFRHGPFVALLGAFIAFLSLCALLSAAGEIIDEMCRHARNYRLIGERAVVTVFALLGFAVWHRLFQSVECRKCNDCHAKITVA